MIRLPRFYNLDVPAEDADSYVKLSSFALDLFAVIGEEGVETSFFRNDGTRHAIGRALDVAFRTGPEADLARRGRAKYYADPEFWVMLRSALRITAPTQLHHPEVERVVVEADHLHIDLTRDYKPRKTSRPILGRYSPPVCNRLACTEGVYPLLRTELDPDYLRA